MNSNDLIKQIDFLLEYYKNCPTGSNYTVLSECRAALEAKCEVVSYFYSGPQGFFYVPTMEQGEIILSLMNVDEEDWTATKLATLPSVDALIAEIDRLETYNPPFGTSEWIDADELKAILDKYRNAK